MNVIVFDKEDISKIHIKELQTNVNQSAQLYKEFWSQLSTGQPDLSKLEPLGSKVKKSVSDAQKNWDKLVQANINDADVIRLYGRFLTEVIHSNEAGSKLLKKADKIERENRAFYRQRRQKSKEDGKLENEVETKTIEQNQNQQQILIIEQEEPLLPVIGGFSSHKALAFIAKDKKMTPPIKKLHFTGLFAMVLLLAIALLGYFFAIKEIDDNYHTASNFDILYKSNLRLAEMLRSASKVRNLYLMNAGLLNNTSGYTEKGLRSDLKKSLISVRDLHIEILQRASSLSQASLDLMNASVVLRFYDNYDYNTGLLQATEHMIARCFDLPNMYLDYYTLSNHNYYFCTYNLLNNYYPVSIQTSQLIAAGLLATNYGISASLLILFIASIAAIVLAVLVILRVLQLVNETKNEALSLFLNIPNASIKSLEEKCDRFIADQQVQGDLPKIEEEFVPRQHRKLYKKI